MMHKVMYKRVRHTYAVVQEQDGASQSQQTHDDVDQDAQQSAVQSGSSGKLMLLLCQLPSYASGPGSATQGGGAALGVCTYVHTKSLCALRT